MLNALVNMGVSTLAFSTDSNQDTVASRLLAIASSTPTAVTEQWLRNEPAEAARILRQYDFIRWGFRPDPTLDDIWYGLYAFHEAEVGMPIRP